MKLEVGLYFRTKGGTIGKIDSMAEDGTEIYFDTKPIFSDKEEVGSKWCYAEDIIKASHNIIDLVEYMDLLKIQNPVKLYDRNIEASFFEPVRCDGFTKFDDAHCIILNLDYLVDIKDLKIKGILTHEQFENNCYKLGDE